MYPVKTICDFKACGILGAVRKYDVHTGVDFYCEKGAPVSCVSGGVVVDVFQFTGEAVGTPWWNDTFAVVVEAGDLVYVYGEIYSIVAIGDLLEAGSLIGHVSPVLKVDKGITPRSMLHLEVWRKVGYIKNFAWELGAPRPEALLDPMEVI